MAFKKTFIFAMRHPFINLTVSLIVLPVLSGMRDDGLSLGYRNIQELGCRHCRPLPSRKDLFLRSTWMKTNVLCHSKDPREVN